MLWCSNFPIYYGFVVQFTFTTKTHNKYAIFLLRRREHSTVGESTEANIFDSIMNTENTFQQQQYYRKINKSQIKKHYYFYRHNTRDLLCRHNRVQ